MKLSRKLSFQVGSAWVLGWISLALLFYLQEFLNDYGMVWVGGSGDESHSKQKLSNQKSVSDGLWVPLADRGESEAVDFDAVVRNVEQLNVIAGGGRTQVITTSDKHAKLKVSLIYIIIMHK